MKAIQEDVFSHLVIGLTKYIENGRKYPYPQELFYALHHLSAAMLTKYPGTITDLLQVFELPLEQWWPGTLPSGIDPRFELLFEGELDEQVTDLLLEYELSGSEALQDIQVILDNRLMVNILNSARNIYLTDPVAACNEYTAIRQYVITHPWTNSGHLRQVLRNLRYIKLQDVSAMYQDARALGSTLLYTKPGTKDACYWICPLCGPLYQRNNQLGSIKPNACLGRCPGPQGWQSLDPSTYPWVLKRGVHLRTHIPGTTEIQLYRWLTQDVQPTKPSLHEVILWPGVDHYDLQLKFEGVTWAVDVKDYKDPFVLGKHIAQDNRHVVEPALEWQKWYYVYPSYREQQRSDYCESVTRAAGKLSPGVAIISEAQFKEYVALQ
jgi:hypothetical protein